MSYMEELLQKVNAPQELRDQMASNTWTLTCVDGDAPYLLIRNDKGYEHKMFLQHYRDKDVGFFEFAELVGVQMLRLMPGVFPFFSAWLKAYHERDDN